MSVLRRWTHLTSWTRTPGRTARFLARHRGRRAERFAPVEGTSAEVR